MNWVINILTNSYAPLAIMAVLCFLQTIAYIRRDDYGTALVFFSYGLADCGFIYTFVKG